MRFVFFNESINQANERVKEILNQHATPQGAKQWLLKDSTPESMEAIRLLLSRNASRNTSVSCHEALGDGGYRLRFIVGSRSRFQHLPWLYQSTTTALAMYHEQSIYDRLLSEITVLAGLFHDLGKSAHSFQRKIHPDYADIPRPDPVRHELVSAWMIEKLLKHNNLRSGFDDGAWLSLLTTKEAVQKQFSNTFADGQLLNERQRSRAKQGAALKLIGFKEKDVETRPCYFSLLALVVTHHQLLKSTHQAESFSDGFAHEAPCINQLINRGLIEQTLEQEEFLMDETRLAEGREAVWFDEQWCAQVAECVQRILPMSEEVQTSTFPHQVWVQATMSTARSALILSDHCYSALKTPYSGGKTSSTLFANTLSDEITQTHNYADTLPYHLKRVGEEAGLVYDAFSRLQNDYGLPLIEPKNYPKPLHKKARKGSRFYWQDDASNKLKAANITGGFFGITQAKTGAGKTRALAKSMMAVNDHLRFNYALGLRSLTLQAGDDYRDELHFTEHQVATLIGSQTAQALHQANQSNHQQSKDDDLDMLSLQGGVKGAALPLHYHHLSEKMQRLIQSPILISTVDHLVPAIDGRRTSQMVLNARLMSADLVLDEIDAYSDKDQIVLGKLVYQAAFYGRKVMLSSATITPGLANGLFEAYWAGYRDHCTLKQIPFKMHGAWITHNEAITTVQPLSDKEDFMHYHDQVTDQLCDAIKQEPVKRKAALLPIEQAIEDDNAILSVYDRVLTGCYQLHNNQSIIDPKTGKRISFGMVRWGLVRHARWFTKYAITTGHPNIDTYHMAYHAKHCPVVLSAYEMFLSKALKGHDDPTKHGAFNHPRLRELIDQSDKDEICFIVSTTSIEEVGRDHDFDWCIMEPSSTRSIIQIAGRVLRHREKKIIDSPNMLLMDTTVRFVEHKALKSGSTVKAFTMPGVESEHVQLPSHRTADVYNVELLSERVDATLMLKSASEALKTSIITQKEHGQFVYYLVGKPHSKLAQWLNHYSLRLHDKFTVRYPFRQKHAKNAMFYLDPIVDGEPDLYFVNETNMYKDPNYVGESRNHLMQREGLDEIAHNKLILPLEYKSLYNQYSSYLHTYKEQLKIMLLFSIELDDYEAEEESYGNVQSYFNPQLGFVLKSKRDDTEPKRYPFYSSPEAAP